ncbi:hypothetical protein DV738_g3077, partial [Chaetothyriales sp. CBS 135597]
MSISPPQETLSADPRQNTSKDDADIVKHELSQPDAAEKQVQEPAIACKKSVYADLGWLDRLLVVWILLAITIGILLGNFVDSVGPALQRGEFAQVSVPIVSYPVVARSVGIFLGIPLAAAIATRFTLRAITRAGWYERVFLRWLAPWSLIGLLYTILVLFASQGRQVVHQIVAVARVAAPLTSYFVIIFSLTLVVTRRLGFGYKLATTQSFTAASNNFELAIAVVVATFGPDSDEALASTVGPLVEVPVLITLVYLVRWLSQRWQWKD